VLILSDVHPASLPARLHGPPSGFVGQIPREIVFPGGAALSQVLAAGSEIPSGLDAATNLLAQASPAMAPLMPIFNILDAVLALVDCVQAVPDALGPPPDPAKMAEALSGLAEKLPKLLGLVPQLAAPRMIIGMLDTLIDFLAGLRDQIEAILRQAERTQAARAMAEELGDENLLHIAGCAEGHAQAQLQAMADALAPMNTLVSALNLFLGLLGLSEIPALDGLIDITNPDAGFAAIDALVETLLSIRDAVPLP
jgi:hypothetical protein